jgi:hypothetical protein
LLHSLQIRKQQILPLPDWHTTALVSDGASVLLLQVPRLEPPIPWRPGLCVVGSDAAGIEVTPELVDELREMIEWMNKVIAALPELQPCPPEGCMSRDAYLKQFAHDR